MFEIPTSARVILKLETRLSLSMNKKVFAILQITLIFSLFFTQPSQAQDQLPPSGPIYIIQPGDNLSAIAARFNVPLDDLMRINGLSNANTISAGAELIIPGLDGISGILSTEIIGYGETLQNISRRKQVPEPLLRKLNHITSPAEMYAGVSLVVPQRENYTPLSNRIGIQPGQSLLESAVLENSDPWTVTILNGLSGTWSPLAGEILYALGTAQEGSLQPNGMPSAFVDVKFSPLPLVQGATAVISIQTQPGVILSGKLADDNLQFFPTSESNKFINLQGIHAMLTPGIYPLKIEAMLPDGTKQSFEQMVVVQYPISGPYPNDPMLSVPPETIDPTITGPESEQITSLTSPVTPQKMWDGVFQLPVALPYCLKSRFGNRRAYNGGAYDNFHGGLDFGICSADHPYDIYAPAAGKVIFTGLLTVRGNATLIDHGWGVYSGYWHQTKILVNTGDMVTAGQLIGEIGETGRANGPHLHWEMWVNGTQVDPQSWLEQVFP